MSRLDSFIRRMQAQRACLDWAVGEIAELPGVVGEFGLGNGRTYDHLRENLPDRDIIVFERKIAAHPGSLPPEHLLLMGDIHDTLPQAVERYAGQMALIHYDMGTGDDARNAALANDVAPGLQALMRPGGVIVADYHIPAEGWTVEPLPEGVREGRYFLYRVV